MNIVVFIKQVPDSPSVRIDRERMTIIREGVESVINPLDVHAVEAALGLRQRGGGEVTAMTMGPPKSEEALREALAMGVDKAVLLTDPRFAGADTLATSHTLARAVSRLNPFPDLILCGMQTADSDTGHVGPQTAEELDIPQACGVHEIHLEEDALVIKRVADGFLETIRVALPALLTVAAGVSPVRYLPMGALENAFSKKLIRWNADDLGLPPEEVGLSGSATRVWKLGPPPPKRKGETVIGSPQDLVGRFLKKLEDLTFLDDAEDETK